MTSPVQRQTGKKTLANGNCHYWQLRQDLKQTVVKQENMIQCASNEETQRIFPQINKNINLNRNFFQQNAASISTGTEGVCLLEYSLCTEEIVTFSQLLSFSGPGSQT